MSSGNVHSDIDIPIKNDDDCNDCTNGHNIAPEMDDEIASHNFEGYKGSLAKFSKNPTLLPFDI